MLKQVIFLNIIIIFLILFFISFLTLFERKLLAGVQRRQGPYFTGFNGVLQPFADGLKLIFKETNFSQGDYSLVFVLASLLSLVLSLLNWVVIPFNEKIFISDINLGLIFIFLISSLNIYSIIFSGWSSNNKYGLIGSVRSGSQLISYEIPLTLSILPIFFFVKSANLLNIINFQVENFWFAVIIPLPFFFFICSLAESNRVPFDLPEAESELIAGYNIEYSSVLFAFFFLAEYNHIIIISLLFSIFFLGGWSFFPFSFFFLPNIVEYLDIVVYHDYFKILIFLLKMSVVINVIIFIRSALPRYRYFDLINICWWIFIPLLLFFFYIYLFILI